MNKTKLLRILGAALVLSLLVALVPAVPVLAVTPTTNTISISPTSVAIGGTVTVSGAFIPTSTEYWINVYLSPNNLTVGTSILISTASTYGIVGSGALLSTLNENADGTFTATFTVPTTLTTGTVDQTVTSGTYYVYATKISGGATPIETGVLAKATLTITAPSLDAPTPASGPAGTEVTLTGTNFQASSTLSFKLDSTTLLNIVAGSDTAVRSSGIFISRITIPTETTATTHTISVYLNSSTTASASTTFTVTASAAVVLVPITGAPGSTIVITGSAYPASTALTFLWDGAAITPTAGTNTVTTTAGGFNSIITVPTTATNGAHVVTASAGATSLTATFTVTGATATTTPTATPTATATPTQTTTPVETATIDFLTAIDANGSVSLFGSDFTPGATVAFSYDGVQLATGTASAKGVVSVTLTLPASVHGDHTITATDGVNYGSLTFAIESIPPDVPIPLSPGMGGKEKAPVTFNWGDVTDASAPVTYNLQIASDPNFIEGSIIIDKTNLTASEYTLTELESALLADSAATYYWRERAVDGAQNVSAWTGAGSFSVTQPLKFTDWPMYVTMAGIGVIAFVIGLLFGRRTAFNF